MAPGDQICPTASAGAAATTRSPLGCWLFPLNKTPAHVVQPPQPLPAPPLGAGQVQLQPAGVYRPQRRAAAVLGARLDACPDSAVPRGYRQRPGRDRRQLAEI